MVPTDDLPRASSPHDANAHPGKATVLERLLQKLDAAGVPYQRQDHPPVYTSLQAAQVRGTSLHSGAKALVCKVDDRFALFVLPADQRLANRHVRRAFGARHLRFATVDEVLQLTGLRPGAIPPFGSLFGLPTFCDRQLTALPKIHFNAGDHCVSLTLATKDYLRAECPILGYYAAPEGSTDRE